MGLEQDKQDGDFVQVAGAEGVQELDTSVKVMDDTLVEAADVLALDTASADQTQPQIFGRVILERTMMVYVLLVLVLVGVVAAVAVGADILLSVHAPVVLGAHKSPFFADTLASGVACMNPS